jgi:hypothetical protein
MNQQVASGHEQTGTKEKGLEVYSRPFHQIV